MTQGTGDGGDYKIEVTRIKEDQVSPQLAKKSEIILEGSVKSDEEDEKIFKLQEEKVLPNDTVSPLISIASPQDGEAYFNDQIIPVGYSITDETSSSDNIAKTIAYDGQSFAENQIDLSLQSLGEHSLKITATDEAGNSSEEEIAFRNTTNLESIQNNVGHYFDLGLIKKKIAKRYLTVRLKHLENLFDLLEKTENSKLKPKPKQTAVQALKEIINADIDRLIKQIRRKTPRWIDPQAAELLVEDLEFVRP